MEFIFLENLYTLPNSTIGVDNIAVQMVEQVPAFVPLLLMFTFFTIFLMGVGRQKLRTGSSDYAMWSTIASMVTFMIALLLTLVSGLIDITVLAIVVTITIFSGVWLFLDKRAGEV